MSTQTKEIVIGDVVKWELPHEYCRANKNISRDLTATVGLNVGEILEADAAVAQITTITALAAAPDPDAGTFKLGYRGQWTAALAFDALVATLKAALEGLSTVTDTVTFSDAIDTLGAAAVTITWGTAGQKDEVEIDGRLMTDGGVAMGEPGVTEPSCVVTTIGSTTAEVVIAVGTGDATCILLEKVTLADLQGKNDLNRACLLRGSCIVDSDAVTVLAAEKADALIALTALGIQFRTEPTIYQSGPPTS